MSTTPTNGKAAPERCRYALGLAWKKPGGGGDLIFGQFYPVARVPGERTGRVECGPCGRPLDCGREGLRAAGRVFAGDLRRLPDGREFRFAACCRRCAREMAEACDYALWECGDN